MKQVAIIAWPRPHATQAEIESIITADGYVVTEHYVGNPDAKWNTLGKDLIVFIAETNNPLRIKDIVGELKKHCCFDVKGIENQNAIAAILAVFKKK